MNDIVRNLLTKLLAFDTTSRESNLALIQFIQSYLTDTDIATQLFYDDSGRKANLYARTGPSGMGGVMLSGHTDVVPVDGQLWSIPPFQLTQQHNRYYGRGSADMKGFIACVLAAVPDFLQRRLRIPLHLAFSYDEEVGCLGVRSLAAYLQASPEKPAMCIIGEPTEMRPVYGHKGKLAMRCQIRGHACHSAYAPLGVNAIDYAAKLITKLSVLGEQLTTHQDKRFEPPYSTLQVGTIQGGTALNIVPQDCQFDFEIRNLPDFCVDHIIQELQHYACDELLPAMRKTARESDITFQSLSQYPGLLTDRQSAFAHWLAQWNDERLFTEDVFTTVAFGTEAGLFNAAGVATLICGPGSMEQAHKPDEYICLDQLERCMKMLRNLSVWMQT